MKVSESILGWLDKNKEWFKVSAICKKVGIDKGNFSRMKKDNDIPEKYLQPIMNIIMPLGFNLEEVIAENNKPANKKKIMKERMGYKRKIKPNTAPLTTSECNDSPREEKYSHEAKNGSNVNLDKYPGRLKGESLLDYKIRTTN